VLSISSAGKYQLVVEQLNAPHRLHNELLHPFAGSLVRRNTPQLNCKHPPFEYH